MRLADQHSKSVSKRVEHKERNTEHVRRPTKYLRRLLEDFQRVVSIIRKIANTFELSEDIWPTIFSRRTKDITVFFKKLITRIYFSPAV